MGAKLNTHLFKVFENPHGVLFNPISVAKSLSDCIQNKQYVEADLFQLNEVWNSWNHHSRYSGITPKDAVEKINNSITKAHSFLKTADHIVITLGSAWVYQLNSQSTFTAGQVVANNHKAPAAWFDKHLMKPGALTILLKKMVEDLLQFNAHLQIIFTISPVRHIRDGVVENNRSKARLIEVVHNLTNEYNYMHYFPAYELIIDVLRDYRFYDIDLVHPNFAATAAVWESFKNSCIEPFAFELMNSIEQLFRAIRHKSRFPATEAHQNFIAQQIALANQLKKSHPYLKMEQLIAEFEQNK